MFAALACGDIATLRQLLADPALALEQHDSSGQTALHAAVASPAAESAVDALLRAGADANAQDARGRTPLLLALETGRFDAVPRLLGVANCAARDHVGRSALHWAMQHIDSKSSVVFDVLSRCDRVAVNAVTHGGDTPLHWLCLEFPKSLRQGVLVIERLIAAGADPLIRNAAGRMPADIVKEVCEPGEVTDVALGLLLSASAPAVLPPPVLPCAPVAAPTPAVPRAGPPAKKLTIKLKR